MDEFLGFGGLFDLDGDGSLDAGETAFGLMMMDEALTDEDADDPTEDPDDLFAAEEDSEMMHEHHEGGCPGSRMMQFAQTEADNAPVSAGKPVSRLAQWPCQIKLLPTQAPFFDGAKLLIAADCTAYAYANMHEDFMKGKITIIGCPKLDAVDYSEKLTAIIRDNDIKSVTIVRMEVADQSIICPGSFRFDPASWSGGSRAAS